MGARGAEFSDVEPNDTTTGRIRNEFFALNDSADGIEGGFIQQVSPHNSFRIGQQIFFWLGFSNTIQNGGVSGAENFITRIRLKPWWLRPNLEYHSPGEPTQKGYTGLDIQTFLTGPSVNEQNNRYCWIPSEKRLDQTEFAVGPSPPASLPRTSDSIMLDDVIAMDLQDPSDATYIANFPAPQQVSRWIAFMYPAHGYALGFTFEAEYDVTPGQGDPPAFKPDALISLTWKVGTLGGTAIQESIG